MDAATSKQKAYNYSRGDGTMTEKILFSIMENCVQDFAKDRIGRKLTKEELDTVSKWLESDIYDYLIEILDTTIDEAVEFCKKQKGGD
jgi:DNA replication protein DnaD